MYAERQPRNPSLQAAPGSVTDHLVQARFGIRGRLLYRLFLSPLEPKRGGANDVDTQSPLFAPLRQKPQLSRDGQPRHRGSRRQPQLETKFTARLAEDGTPAARCALGFIGDRNVQESDSSWWAVTCPCAVAVHRRDRQRLSGNCSRTSAETRSARGRQARRTVHDTSHSTAPRRSRC
jgi:hypothetical protein